MTVLLCSTGCAFVGGTYDFVRGSQVMTLFVGPLVTVERQAALRMVKGTQMYQPREEVMTGYDFVRGTYDFVCGSQVITLFAGPLVALPLPL